MVVVTTATATPAAATGRDEIHTDASTVACCAPLTHQPLDSATASTLARRLRALADPTRLQLVSLVAAADEGEVCMCDLIEPVGLSQPTVSHHLRIIVEAGLLSRDKRGVWAYYRVVPGALDALADVLRTSGRG
jgi:ArsR family transcriptional regulator, arsenate/arsenite/antimonite-responsive transcriptional repressor